MEKEDFIKTLKILIENDDVLGVSREVNELRTQFEDYLLEAERQHQIAVLKAEESGDDFTETDDSHLLREEFYKYYDSYKEKLKKHRDAKQKEEQENLSQKRILLNKLKDLINNEENIGVAFSTHKEINEQWKKIGNVPRNLRNEIQQEYSRLLEDFFYNIRIYKEILEYDFKKNYETKKELISKLKELEKEQNIKIIESEIKRLQELWDDIGPTKQELWEEIKDEYWKSIHLIYSRIHNYYEERRRKSQENIVLKKELIKKVEAILQQERTSIKDWNNHTKKIIAIQDEWKKIGFGPRKENEEVWKAFRSICDDFFKQKEAFFKSAQHEFDAVAEIKKQLIEKAESIKGSTNWDITTKEIIRLQKQWKKAGNAGRKQEQILWKKFRGICDGFFNAKNSYYEQIDKEFEDNLKKKNDLIEEIKSFVLPEDKQEAIEKLKDFSERFSKIGFVPKNEKDKVFSDYKEAVYSHYEALNIKGKEREKVMFEMRLSTIKGSDNSSQLFAKEKQSIRNEINAIKQQVLQLENNLGFFARSKGANPLKQQVENNILKEKEKIDLLKEKLKLIPDE